MLVLGLVDLPWWAILLLLCVAFYLYETRNHSFFKDQGIPFMKPVIIFGSMMAYKEGMAEGDMEIYRKYKKRGMVGEFFGDRIALTVWDEKFLADVLVKESSIFMNHITFNDPAGLMGKMLIAMRDETWKNARNEMSPTFTTGKLKTMNVAINKCAKVFGEYLLEKAETGEANIDVKDYTGSYTMSVISSTAFGMQVDSLKDKNNVFIKNVKELFSVKLDKFQPRVIIAVYFPVLASLLRRIGLSFEMHTKEAEHFFVNVTKQALQIRREDEDQSRTDFLQLMVNAEKGEDMQGQDGTSSQRKGLTTDEIIANAMLFFAAGYDTTANTLSFLMYSLATNPEVQTRLIEEIDTVVKDKDSVSYSVVQEMPYLEQCINETMRLYPIAIKLNRVASRDITLHGVFIKKGMIVQVPVFAMQRDSDRWPDPERFDPERFSPENKKGRNPYHYLPFGCGPRICIGQRLAIQELKLAVIHMLKRVTVETCDKTEIPMRFAKDILLRPADLWLKTVKR